MKQGWTYILTNKHNSVFYTGMTSDIYRRIWEHKTKSNPESFSARYNTNKLVYCEHTEDIRDAIEWEMKIKGKSRRNKKLLIQRNNPEWIDLAVDWFE